MWSSSRVHPIIDSCGDGEYIGSRPASGSKRSPQFSGNWKIHLYGKRGNLEARRKMGHLTIKTGQPGQEVTRIKTIFQE
ncbi:hypothetical protein [Desulforamulus profundi]|uniref:hypothetical protein n=1 Tax=Desulforamulus profundi TaxID=1383067 RepID=UPI003B75C9A5